VDIRDLIAPRRCLACRAVGSDPLCRACAATLIPIDDDRCLRCGRPTAFVVASCRECAGRRLSFRTARAALVHDDAAAALLRAWKDHGLQDAGRILVDACVNTLRAPEADAVTHVPAAAHRARWRGVDPPVAIARCLGEAWGTPVVALLERVADRPQRGLDRAARRRNAARSFRVPDAVSGRVLLVDDVYTTGATASACARALRRAGASEVIVVTATRVVAEAGRYPPSARRWASDG
jgi:predicted amidophosphoribosyltransferase